MEECDTIILKDLDSVYPALYDLFNQNFTTMCKKNFTRISVGTRLNAFTYVHENFKCIVFVDEDKIDKQEPPFLNRFEKHISRYENLLNDNLISTSKKIQDKIDELISFGKNNKRINYDLKKILINCELEEIQGIIYNSQKKGIKDFQGLLNQVLLKISPILPQDIIIPLKFNNVFDSDDKDFIFKNYTSYEHRNFSNFLKSIDNKKNVVYTFSKILETIKNIDNIKNDKLNFKIDNKNNIKFIKIGGIKSEDEFENYLDDYFNNNECKICIIQFLPEECIFINYVNTISIFHIYFR